MSRVGGYRHRGAWAVLGWSWGGLGPSFSVIFLRFFNDFKCFVLWIALGGLGLFWGGLGASWGDLGAVLGRLGAVFGGLGTVLCSLQPVLGRSWALLEESWVVLGRSGVRILRFLWFYQDLAPLDGK